MRSKVDIDTIGQNLLVIFGMRCSERNTANGSVQTMRTVEWEGERLGVVMHVVAWTRNRLLCSLTQKVLSVV